MAHTLSAEKRLRQSRKRHARNRAVKSRIKTCEKKFLQAVRENDLDRARAELSAAARLLDRAARKGIIHRNKAARRKARLAARLKA